MDGSIEYYYKTHKLDTESQASRNPPLVGGVSDNQTDRYREEYGDDGERELGMGKGI